MTAPERHDRYVAERSAAVTVYACEECPVQLVAPTGGSLYFLTPRGRAITVDHSAVVREAELALLEAAVALPEAPEPEPTRRGLPRRQPGARLGGFQRPEARPVFDPVSPRQVRLRTVLLAVLVAVWVTGLVAVWAARRWA